MDATVILVNVVGWLGMALLIGAYALVSTGRVEGTGRVYQAMNLFGALFLVVNSAYYRAWPSAGLNVVWIGIGIAWFVRSVTRRGATG